MFNMAVIKISESKRSAEGTFARSNDIVAVRGDFNGLCCAILIVVKNAFLD